ncbi:hypothetical protein AAFF_G00217690 [Aldrovandia affinis]|uniref:Uncharacterized protein n=1 Tax=Aldrovandia affinis TaxID=143900 RepID=A0AAD7WUQ8_9TELE|nr:hypothetical protein AAFF_G00217690 [Aldrovandia affinis]
MDIKTKANIQAKIRKDYGSLNDCVDYVATVVLCWGRTKFEEHKEILEHFLSLREKGQVPAYITPEDMKDWIISEGRNILKERFQMECADQRDGLIHLYYFDPHTVVRRAVRDIIQQLARVPVARPHTLSEVVVDTVTRLFRRVVDDGEEPFNRKSSSRLLSGVAVGTTVIVLQDVCAEERHAAQELRVQYSHSTRASVVSMLHRELLERTGSPEVLKAALRGKREVRNQRKGIRHFFSRTWKALTFCCCCISVETD